MLRTRGIERVRLSAPGAPGAVSSIGYGLLHDVRRRWLRIAHLSLPISNPAYPDAGTWTGSDEDEARRRVPVAVAADWTARYSTGFDDIHPYLEKLAIGQTASFPASADPDAPKSALEPLSAIMLAAAFDPHVRRIVGLGFDDTSVAMDGTEWAYQVTGQWDAPHLDVRVLSREAWSSVAGKVTASSAHGDLEFSGGGTVMKTESWSRPATLFFRPQPVDVVILTVGAVRAETLVAGLRGSRSAPAPGLVWRAFGPQGGELAEGAATLTAGSQTTIEIGARGIDRVEFGRPEGGPVTFVLYRIVARVAGVAGPGAILPSIFATEPGPPKSPGWISARPEQPDGTTPREPGSTSSLRAALEWELVASPEGVYDDAAPVLHQVAAHQLSTDPAAPKPAAVPFDEAYLLNDGRPVLVPSETAAVADVRRRYYTDKGLQEGWRSWWTRSVDWFGRVGEPSPPALERLEDHALPPPPDILHAEYVQADLPAEDAALLGRSWLGREWLSAHPSANAVAVAFGWSPERVAQAPDVDGFRVYVREPAIVTSAGPNEASERYEGVAWGPPRAQVGPIPVRFQGAVTNVAPGIQGVTVTAVTALDGTHAACATDLALDWGGGRLIGGVLASGGSTYLVAGNGDGANVSITVEHTAGAPPQPGAYDLLPGTSRIATVVTNLAPPPLAGAGIRRRASGVLAGATARLAVLGQDGGAFLCRIPPDVTPPAAGDAVTWFPAYSIVVPDTGFGPQASPARPTAHAQVTVRSVRRWSARPLESLDASPGRLTAVDATPPPAPFSFDFIPSGPHCAQVGTRANWYGVSYVTLGWASSPHLEYVVHRALGDAVMMLDAEVHATDPHVFPQSKWPPALWADTSRRAAVLSELAALDAALATANGAAIRSAYAGLGAGAQQLIAGQTEVEDAFVPLTEAPLQGSSFTDEVDGRSRAHWFYRLSARTRSGLESGKSLATPPICCPDVVPPAPPLGQLALATDGAVRIRWLISRDGDLSHYLLYRT
ncbi:MAG TPA: hypothetical protein VHN37_06035, partial [Actinomycetota bacterium]|nr:hypothetical protein [Actinomycetota bacterium]